MIVCSLLGCLGYSRPVCLSGSTTVRLFFICGTQRSGGGGGGEGTESGADGFFIEDGVEMSWNNIL